MNKEDMIKIGIAAFVVIILIVVVVIVTRKKDNYEYPANILYAPTGEQAWIKQSGNGGLTITQTNPSALVADLSGNVSASAAMPIGGIIMWAGTIVSIPTGWGLCNGTTYGSIESPDLTSRFVVGAGTTAIPLPTDYVTQYKVGDTGGEEFHQLTIEEMPSHSHGYAKVWVWSGAGYSGGGNDIGGPGATDVTGGDPANKDIKGNPLTLPHNNMPPYYALAYIIKYA